MNTENKNICIITLSEEGFLVAEKIKKNRFHNARIFVNKKTRSCIPENRINSDIRVFKEGIYKLTADVFSEYSALIFIMPIGIVVRAISPHLKSKYADPAAAVVDIAARNVISVLSGHEGGANRIAEITAAALRTNFIITTSTEAVKRLIIGLGCRKGISKDEIREGIDNALVKINKQKSDIRLIATVDKKENEKGLIEYCRENNIPLRIISRMQIKNSRIKCKTSGIVKRALGIKAVAEPCAMLGGTKTELIMEKIKCKRLTLAAAEENLL